MFQGNERIKKRIAIGKINKTKASSVSKGCKFPKIKQKHMDKKEISTMSCYGPPSPTCAPRSPPPCLQSPVPTVPPPACIPKPKMRRLHFKQTMGVIAQALTLSAIGGLSVYFFIGRPRMAAYREFYENGEFEEWAEEMAKKGLFQSTPSQKH